MSKRKKDIFLPMATRRSRPVEPSKYERRKAHAGIDGCLWSVDAKELRGRKKAGEGKKKKKKGQKTK